jgi:hypothetical protein
MRKPFVILTLVSAGLLAGCGPGSTVQIGPDGTVFNAGGSFLAEGTNILEGMSWQLNRPIRIEFNHAVDPTSISFGSIQIRAMDPGSVTTPVTGTFELEAGTGGRVILFRPACPTDNENSNGAFLPGGYTYELFLPTQSSSPTVLRDTEGHSLELGLSRTFVTPQPSQPQFLDRVAGPPVATSVTFPEGLNLFSDPNPVVSIRFNQAIDGRDTNLNTNNLQLLYADDEIGTAGANSFSADNQLPGNLVLIENCGDNGALVEFRITGILPVNRNLSLRLGPAFTDLVGQANTSTLVIGSHATPTLGALYNDPTWTETDLAADEFRDDFETAAYIDQDVPLSVPAARLGNGFVSAGFDYPGSFVSEDNDFTLLYGANGVIITDSQSVFTDSNNRQHTVQNGVLNVNDFTIASGATLRGRGNNPLVIYATGTVDISGTLDVSGNNATWPTSLNSPQFVEGGAAGECGGGRGGDASQNGTAETLRAEDGDGPFGQEGGGGGGGEGGFNADFSNTGLTGLNGTMVGGGGGGGFARTMNESVLWADWPTGNGDWRPYNVDNAGPDHKTSRHTAMVLTNPSDYSDFGYAIFGSEPGIRGTMASTGTPGVEKIRGMEDGLEDNSAMGNTYDPPWTTGMTEPINFDFGSPTAGPDRGEAGPSVFSTASNDRRFLKDFYGSRLMADGSVNTGSLLAPWAGSGGGGSGDSMLIEVWDRDGDGTVDPLDDFYPVVPFQRSGGNSSDGWDTYRKGAGGGGGGGQLIIMAIGNIKIGSSAEIKANGGIGFSGESLIYSDQGISGSGGGSGGHIILATSGKLDLSAIDVGTANTAADVPNLTQVNNIQAFGGRRGWAGPDIVNPSDGNQTFATSRGGAGANGIIQIHVPNPKLDVIWHPNAATGIALFLAEDPVPTDHAEEVFDLISAPRAYCLVPFYSSQSRFVSKWIDTGAAELRLGAPDNYPNYGHNLLKFDGISTASLLQGRVLKTGDNVTPLADVATGSTSAVTFTAYTLTIPDADTVFAATPLYLRSPNLLVGYDILPDSTGATSFEVVDVAYNATTKVMVLTTSTLDGPMTFALNGANPTWSMKKKFFRVATSGQKDYLPSSTNVYVQFQVADEDPANPNMPGDPIGTGDTFWHQDLTASNPIDVVGHRFIRYRVTFDANAGSGTMDLSSPLPLIEYIKIPFIW